MEDRMMAMEGEARRYVLEIERELQRLRAERVALFVIQMRAAVFVRERDRGQSATAEADLRRLNVADERVRAVAADLFLVNQLDCRTRREPVQIVTIRERVLQRFDNRLGNVVLRRGALEA